MGQTQPNRLNDMWQEECESFKSYFARVSAKLITCEKIFDEKAYDAVQNKLLIKTSFQQDVYNKNLAFYHQLVSLIQNKIHTKDTIENWKKWKRDEF